jgi:hypothetical protein
MNPMNPIPSQPAVSRKSLVSRLWATFKSLPVLGKVIVVCLALGIVYGATHDSDSGGNVHQSVDFVTSTPRPNRDHNYEQHPNNVSTSVSRQLAQLQAQHAQIVAQATRCEAEMTRSMGYVAQGAMSGQMVNAQPPCQQYMNQWITQTALLETEIYQLQTGSKGSVCEITAVCPTSSPASNYANTSNSDEALEAVERTSREGTRGNCFYTDTYGEKHELPCQNYYYQDRSSGQFVSRDRPEVPNDGRDYDAMEYSSR